MHSRDIRKKFIDFFVEHGHTYVQSSALIPAQDPTLLFTNAGMNQFKDLFLGKETRSYKRAVSIQKCIRAGGKHNDLENVGFTKRHLTFFEMMGNFSFGDYFKRDAIRFAWDFLTKVVQLEQDKLYASVYKLDDEAYAIWQTEIGLPQERIVRLGEADNFWQMGDTGPCGPCSEIYIDRGLKYGCGQAACAPGCSCDRFLEIWNLVFMQFDRQADGTDKPLKHTGVDTGMGLERLVAVIQDKDSVFETDIFEPLIARLEELTGRSYAQATPEIQAAFRVIVDHIRSSCFALADGCTPSNEGRGYVLRKIIRRAALFCQKLSEKNIFPDLVQTLAHQMGDIYPELTVSQTHITALLTSETEKFAHNLTHGQTILNSYFQENNNTRIITGAQAFKLYDTYGFPLELTNVIAHEHGFTVDTQEFEVEMEKQRLQSGKKLKTDDTCHMDESLFTHFTGYDEHVTQSKIIGILVNNTLVQEVPAGTLCSIITSKSPFYIECGGQISDEGTVKIGSYETKLLGIKKVGTTSAALLEAPTALKVGDTVTLIVDMPTRLNTMKNHTATHLLQAALITFLGKGVKQSGSVVTPDYLRFDFTYHENLTPEQIVLIEDLVNKKILENLPVKTEHTNLKEATSRGVIAFFGEKYNPEQVRVIEIPGFSAELCGGTHVRATGDIGLFKITEVTALSAGNRRLVAVTGPAALLAFQETFVITKALGQEFKVTQEHILDAIKKQKEQLREAQQEAKELKKQLSALLVPTWLKDTKTVATVPFLYKHLRTLAASDLKDTAQELIKAQPGIYFLTTTENHKASFFVAVAPQLAHRINLKNFGAWLKELGLQGGGSGTSIQGGAVVLPYNLEPQIVTWLEANLAN
ncbi:alanine--tRNA ligase [Candidatus Dependentiae bacterium]|nr:alanine--tRNA ligase [Candidatus Dependentiae bacterium]